MNSGSWHYIDFRPRSTPISMLGSRSVRDARKHSGSVFMDAFGIIAFMSKNQPCGGIWEPRAIIHRYLGVPGRWNGESDKERILYHLMPQLADEVLE